MTRDSKIEWTDHTFNPWVGCTKISPGCDHCYAETWAKRSGSVAWGGPRRRTSTGNWRQPLKWNAEASAADRRDRVFCASLADVFDNEVDPQWRVDLFRMILETSHLDWLLLTKRIGNANRILHELIPSWSVHPLQNVWIGATVVNQEEADRDIPKLLDTPAAVRFLSCEPLLGPIDLTRVVYPLFKQKYEYDPYIAYDTLRGHMIGPDDVGLPHLDWVIAGGESGHHARPMHPDWARSLRDQCTAAGVPFLFKQWGEWAPGGVATRPALRVEATASWFDGHWSFGALTPAASESLHRDDEPDLYRLGKKAAGRWLDGRTWDQFPRAA